jgi:hypothetical protein
MKKRVRVCLAALAICLIFLAGRGAALFCSTGLSAAARLTRASADQTLTDCLYEGLMQEAAIVEFTHLASPVGEEELRQAFSYLYASRPELYFVSDRYTLSVEGGRVLYMRPTYRMTGQAHTEAQATFDEQIAAILTPICPDWSELRRVTYLHDYLITRFSYDYSYENYDAYSLLTTGTGVCQAYTLLFQVLCERAGIACACVLCFEKEHEWNQVQIDGAWYHIDLTWDETESDQLAGVSHTYFLLSDDELRTRRAQHSADWMTDDTWDAPYPCTESIACGA